MQNVRAATVIAQAVVHGLCINNDRTVPNGIGDRKKRVRLGRHDDIMDPFCDKALCFGNRLVRCDGQVDCFESLPGEAPGRLVIRRGELPADEAQIVRRQVQP